LRTVILFLLLYTDVWNSYFQIMRDPETGNSRGFGFISYDSFEASDAAIEVTPRIYVLQTFEKQSFSVARDLHKLLVVF